MKKRKYAPDPKMETIELLVNKRDRLNATMNELLETLQIIATGFMTPEEIRANDIGLPYEEQLEMAYENIIQLAQMAVAHHKELADGN